MPLSIRDGNSSLTTLSTLLVNSVHVPAHTVVSLGSQAITDIATAVSGVELGPNTLNALENISVTMGQVTITGGLTDAQLRASSVTIGGSVQVSNLPATQTVTFSQASVTFGTPIVTGSVSVLNFPATQAVTFTQAPVTFGTAVITGSASILNFPATQTVTFSQASVTFGQVQGSVTATISGTPSVTFGQASVTFGTPTVTGSVSVLNFPATQTVAGTVTANVTNSVTVGAIIGPSGGNCLKGISGSGDAVRSLLFTRDSAGSYGEIQGSGINTFNLPVYGTVTVGNSVTIGSLPAISGTVTANLANVIEPKDDYGAITQKVAVQIYNTEGQPIGGGDGLPLPISGTVTANVDSNSLYGAFENYAGNWVTPFPVSGAKAHDNPTYFGGVLPSQLIRNTDGELLGDTVPLSVSGTVTANGGDFSATDGAVTPPDRAVAIGFYDSASSNLFKLANSDDQLFPVCLSAVLTSVTVGVGNSVTIGSLPAISGTVTANVMGFDCVNNEYSPIPVLPYNESIDCGNTVIARITDTNGTDLNLSNGMPISGTVTVGAMPNGALTTRFGSVTTANTAQITSAVTNTSRKYLLAQNISAGTVTIGIGFSPTTTQGIQLTAGGGLTFDAFCPTGAVYWLGAVTGAAFTILEA